MRIVKTLTSSVALALAVLASASTWFYMNRVLRADQLADAAAHHRPRGNLSDLYPRWLGARELLLHGRNPYSPEITREIQQGYYGRPLDPTRPDDPKDEQGFAYPVYVAFLLAPTVRLPFEIVETGFRWLLIALAVATIPLWLRVLRWKTSCATILIFCLLSAGWLPMVQGIKLQQLTLLVAALLAACGACLAGGWLFLGGGLLAFATFKPQLAWPIVLWLLLWAVSDWRARRRFIYGFALVMLLLLGGAELLLPGWLRLFAGAIGQYHRYTQNQSVLVFMFGTIAGRIFELFSVLACAAVVWRMRHRSAGGADFGRAFALVLALTVVVVPMFAPYNQVLLAPAILMLVWAEMSWREISETRSDETKSGGGSQKDSGQDSADEKLFADPGLPAVRLARRIVGLIFIWPWIATVALSLASFWLTPELRHRLWPMPFYPNFIFPVLIFGLVLVETWLLEASLPEIGPLERQR
jgi:hypothetical protein